eukprot:CAMPEP_0197533478 /NCGR_PEP_ID=MMETSP1318-20131121/43608_1 /TAXON_ID=552666 /ORGANISM="Partenskyella glossopodia, Strain RCC365" /LENGTH=256 /DNA_ID=CAMNT_0043090391 /DNA_START=1 /DNA_END=771 /DNA_ORIENTATION=+
MAFPLGRTKVIYSINETRPYMLDSICEFEVEVYDPEDPTFTGWDDIPRCAPHETGVPHLEQCGGYKINVEKDPNNFRRNVKYNLTKVNHECCKSTDTCLPFNGSSLVKICDVVPLTYTLLTKIDDDCFREFVGKFDKMLKDLQTSVNTLTKRQWFAFGAIGGLGSTSNLLAFDMLYPLVGPGAMAGWDTMVQTKIDAMQGITSFDILKENLYGAELYCCRPGQPSRSWTLYLEDGDGNMIINPYYTSALATSFPNE